MLIWHFIRFSVAYLENVVNICIINDVSYPPATRPQIIRMHFFINQHTHPLITRSARGYNRHPRITNTQACVTAPDRARIYTNALT